MNDEQRTTLLKYYESKSPDSLYETIRRYVDEIDRTREKIDLMRLVLLRKGDPRANQ